MAVKFKIRKGDKVVVITGKDKGKQGEVVQMLLSENRAVVRGDPESGSFALYYFAGSELLAVDAINSMRDFMTGKRWLAERKRPDPALLADPTVDLKTI